MKFSVFALTLCALLATPLAAHADAGAHDLLAGFPGGAQTFCNLLNHARHLPETNTACGVMIELLDSPANAAAIANGEFGAVSSQIKIEDLSSVFVLRDGQGVNLPLPAHSNLLILGSTVSLEQLERLRYDSRIYALAPDFPMGPTGGVSSAGGGN